MAAEPSICTACRRPIDFQVERAVKATLPSGVARRLGYGATGSGPHARHSDPWQCVVNVILDGPEEWAQVTATIKAGEN